MEEDFWQPQHLLSLSPNIYEEALWDRFMSWFNWFQNQWDIFIQSPQKWIKCITIIGNKIIWP